MPQRPTKHPNKARKKPTKVPRTSTNETHGHLSGLYIDFSEQVNKYVSLVHHLFDIQARVELVEKNLVNTREYFAEHIARCKDAVPEDWSVTLAKAKYVGVRLSEACMGLLREHRRMTPQELVNALNEGQYRWRTPTPFREIHGALLKQSWATRNGDDYIWTGPDPQMQLVMGAGSEETGEKKAS